MKIFYGNLLFFPYRKPVWTVGKYIVAFDIVFCLNLFANTIVFFLLFLLFYSMYEKQTNINIVGEPILIDEIISEPTKHQIDQLQEQYINALQRLYEQYKHQYNHGNIELIIK